MLTPDRPGMTVAMLAGAQIVILLCMFCKGCWDFFVIHPSSDNSVPHRNHCVIVDDEDGVFLNLKWKNQHKSCYI